MIHSFKFVRKGKPYYFTWDIEGGSLFGIDLPVFLLLKKQFETLTEEENAQYLALTEAEIAEAQAEIDAVIAEGLLNTPTPEIEYHKREEIKALCIHICHDCNLKCTYCFASEGTYNTAHDYITADTGKKAIDFLVSHSGNRKNLEVDFFGGEPLLNMDVVKEIVDYGRTACAAASKTISYTMTTNCILLDEKTREYLDKEMENVVLSIDGRACVHDRVRKSKNGKDTHAIVLKNALAMAQLRGDKKHYARGTFTAYNLDFAADVQHLSDMGFHQISVEPVVLPEDSPMAIQKEHIEDIKAEYDKLANLYLDRIGTDKWFNFFHFMIDLKHGPCLHKRLNGCGAGADYVAVSPIGDIYPCHQFVGELDFRMGSVLTGEFNREIQHKFADVDVRKKDDCKNCFAKYYCSGGCAANAHHFNGDITKPYKQACEMSQKRLELSLALYAFENGLVEEND